MTQPNRLQPLRDPLATDAIRRQSRRVVLLVDDSRSFSDLLALQLRQAG